MSVVLRCPNCGTTKPTTGECEACHEAPVRYFCTNHTPGLWLDARTCARCGSVFGDAARPAEARAPARPVASRAPAPASVAAARRPKAAAGESIRRERLPPADEEGLATSASPLAAWKEILRAAVRARYMPTRGAPERELPRMGLRVAGCLTRLVLLIAVVFIGLLIAAFFFGQALLQGI